MNITRTGHDLFHISVGFKEQLYQSTVTGKLLDFIIRFKMLKRWCETFMLCWGISIQIIYTKTCQMEHRLIPTSVKLKHFHFTDSIDLNYRDTGEIKHLTKRKFFHSHMCPFWQVLLYIIFIMIKNIIHNRKWLVQMAIFSWDYQCYLFVNHVIIPNKNKFSYEIYWFM